MTAANQPPTIVIVGGVAAGASAATRARRMNEHAEIILLEQDAYVSFANCGLPYYIGGEIADRNKLLVATAEFLRRRYRLDVRPGHQAVAVDRQHKTVAVVNRATGERYAQPYDKLILAPGGSPVRPSVEGADAQGVFVLRNLEDADRIREAVEASGGGRAAIVGAGYIGLELAEQLKRRGWDVAVAELEPQVLPVLDPEMAKPVEQSLRAHGVALHLGAGLRRVLVDERGAARAVELAGGVVVESALVLLAMGVRPNVALARDAGLALGPDGGIAVNRFLQTSDPDIYAAGDAVEYVFGPTGQPRRIPLAGPANRAGRLAGWHAATGQACPMADVFGTAIVRVFDQCAAVTGLTAKAAARAGLPYRSVTIVANHHAGYYPGAAPLTLKLGYDPRTGRVLGAQIVGAAGVDKRIDVIATAMAFQATVRDLSGLDLAYAPPFGAAKDPVHIAAFVACNQLDRLEDIVQPGDDLRGKLVVDVRTPPEVAKRPIPGAEQLVNVPLDELRERLDELDPKADIVVCCGVGLRAHIAARILKQRGFDNVANLTGGATVCCRAKEA